MASESSLFTRFLRGLETRITTEDELKRVQEKIDEIKQNMKDAEAEWQVDNIGEYSFYCSLKPYAYDSKRIGCTLMEIPVKMKNRGVRCDGDDVATEVLYPDELEELLENYSSRKDDGDGLCDYDCPWLDNADYVGCTKQDVLKCAQKKTVPPHRWISVGDWDDPLHEAWVTVPMSVYYVIPPLDDFCSDIIYRTYNIERRSIEYVVAITEGMKTTIRGCTMYGKVYTEESDLHQCVYHPDELKKLMVIDCEPVKHAKERLKMKKQRTQ